MQNSEVETLYFLIIAEATLVKNSIVPKHIGLTCLALAKAKKNLLGNRIWTIGYGVDAAVALANDLVIIGTLAKAQMRVGFQNLTTVDGCQGTTHRICQALCGQRSVTLSTGAASHITHAGKLMSRPPF